MSYSGRSWFFLFLGCVVGAFGSVMCVVVWFVDCCLRFFACDGDVALFLSCCVDVFINVALLGFLGGLVYRLGVFVFCVFLSVSRLLCHVVFRLYLSVLMFVAVLCCLRSCVSHYLRCVRGYMSGVHLIPTSIICCVVLRYRADGHS